MDCFYPDHPLTRALVERGYKELTPVQSAVLAADAKGRDLLVSAQTG
jgi:ATP-dependent RNA helicase DeaD